VLSQHASQSRRLRAVLPITLTRRKGSTEGGAIEDEPVEEDIEVEMSDADGSD